MFRLVCGAFDPLFSNYGRRFVSGSADTLDSWSKLGFANATWDGRAPFRILTTFEGPSR
jgi:hypothetical protein